MCHIKIVSLISFILINCLIQISCDIAGNQISSELIDSLNNDKSYKNVEVGVMSDLSPAEEVSTKDCDCNSREDCHKTCLDDDRRNLMDNMFLLTAGEVLLGTAIIMGLSAVVTMLLRVCTRNRMFGSRRHASNLDEAFDRNGNRTSVSSLQQSVLTKMRDRPPRYETRHNYEYRQRDNEGGSSEENSRPTILNPRAGTGAGPPPPYENDDNSSVQELPPAYTIAIPSSSDESGGNLRVTNQSSAIEESRQEQTTSSSGNAEVNDKILHI